MRLFLYLLGFFIGLTVPWYFYINHVTETIVSEQWEVPSVVYARPLELYKNKKLSAQALAFELDLLGYQQVNTTPQLGQYQIYQNNFDIYSKGFAFADGATKPKRVKLELVDGAIKTISPELYRLEPKVIGHFFSSGLENRQPIKVSALPNTLVTGLQAVEDREFSQHHGVSWFGILRAAFKNLMAGEVVQGGSTITQQLVKNKLQYTHNSLLRKLHEALAATLLESKLDKKAIIEMYFNEIYWGQDGKVSIHGVVEAASYYFAKPVSRLSIAEQALLIGIIKGPSWYNPFKQAERALDRRNLVLKTWLETGVIDQSQWLEASKNPLGLSQHRRLKTDFEDYMDVVKLQLRSEFSRTDLNQKGLKIFTYLDPYIQYKTSQTATKANTWLSADVENAIVVSGAQNAELYALSGSKSTNSHYNRAILAKRQIGSLIKPLVYLAGLELLADFNLNKNLQDMPINLKTDDNTLWQPKNWDQQSWGEISAWQALIHSRNQAAVDLGLKMGLKPFIKFLTNLGLNINRSNHPSLFLGAIELSPFEVQHLFGLFSSRGRNQQVYAINYITQSDGKLLTQSKQLSKNNLSTAHIDAINQALNAITIEGTAKKITDTFHLPGPLFGKTGTTNLGRDSWFSGFNQDLLVTVWVGRDDNQPTSYSGGSGALVLWSHLLLNL
jgi:penicillin-binding protein 1B